MLSQVWYTSTGHITEVLHMSNWYLLIANINSHFTRSAIIARPWIYSMFKSRMNKIR